MPRPSKTRHDPASPGQSGPVVDLKCHIATRVAIFANRLSRAASRFYRTNYGIGVVEWRLMMFIGRAGETRANRICKETDLDKGAVSRGLRTLQRMGIVSLKEDSADSRSNNVALTAKGRALHDELVPVALERQERLASDLTSEEIAVFLGLIDRLQPKVSDGEPETVEDMPKRLSSAKPRLTHAPRRGGSPTRRVSARRG